MTQSDFAGIPLAAGSIFGARQWGIDQYGRLCGITHADVWTPFENVAFCNRAKDRDIDAVYRSLVLGSDHPRRDPNPCGDVTSPGCACGFYAYFDAPKLEADYSYAVGIIEGYGKATIGSKGFRCEKARIVAIGGTNKIGRQNVLMLERNYPDVPKFGKWNDMLAAHPLSTEYIPTPELDPEFWTRGALPRPDAQAITDQRQRAAETTEKMKGALDWRIVQGDYNRMMTESSQSYGFWPARKPRRPR